MADHETTLHAELVVAANRDLAVATAPTPTAPSHAMPMMAPLRLLQSQPRPCVHPDTRLCLSDRLAMLNVLNAPGDAEALPSELTKSLATCTAASGSTVIAAAADPGSMTLTLTLSADEQKAHREAVAYRSLEHTYVQERMDLLLQQRNLKRCYKMQQSEIDEALEENFSDLERLRSNLAQEPDGVQQAVQRIRRDEHDVAGHGAARHLVNAFDYRSNPLCDAYKAVQSNAAQMLIRYLANLGNCDVVLKPRSVAVRHS